MKHSTKLLDTDVLPVLFYKAPVPLLIGNLPFGNDFKNNLHEYQYLDYYLLPSAPDSGDAPGVLFYNKFYKKYVFLCGNSATWDRMYPGFYIENSGVEARLNPFVNDVNGACTWINENQTGKKIHSLIYFNFEKNRYEWGLGEDAFNYNGIYFSLNSLTKCNHSWKRQTVSIPNVNLDSTPTISTAENNEGIKTSTLDKDRGTRRGFLNYFNSDSEITGSENFDYSNLANPDNLDNNLFGLTVENSYHKNFSSSKRKGYLRKFPYISNNNSVERLYERLDILKDLDHEEYPDKYEEICGVYENNYESSLKQCIVGSVVIGTESSKDSLGWFVCINTPYNPFYTSLGKNFNTYQPKFSARILVQKNKDVLPGSNLPINLDNYDFIMPIGCNIHSNNKKFLVYYATKNTEGFYKKGRLYIVDNDPAILFSQKKIWYADLPLKESVTMGTSAPELNKHPFEYYYAPSTFTSLEFKYINLDDNSDTKDSVVFKIIGASRENANFKLYGRQISYSDLYVKSSLYTKQNVYVGYWDTPIVNFKG